eukprot:9735828-Ditylum_brightwellii.AAC.1
MQSNICSRYHHLGTIPKQQINFFSITIPICPLRATALEQSLLKGVIYLKLQYSFPSASDP